MSICHVYFVREAQGKTCPLKLVIFCLVPSCPFVHLPKFYRCYHQFLIEFYVNMADQQYRRRLGEAEMNRGIGILQAGFSQRHVANVLGVSQSVVSRFWNRFLTTGNVSHLHAGGR